MALPFLLNYQAQGAFGKNEQSTQTPWRGAQCSCIGCSGVRRNFHGGVHSMAYDGRLLLVCALCDVTI